MGCSLVPATSASPTPGACCQDGWVGRSVHGRTRRGPRPTRAPTFSLAGTIFTSASHPGVAAKGPGFIAELASVGAPVIAIGGITPERAGEVQAAGAWGVAAIRSIWDASDPARAVLAMLEQWEDQ